MLRGRHGYGVVLPLRPPSRPSSSLRRGCRPRNQQGGAVYVEDGSCAGSFSDCSFTSNGNLGDSDNATTSNGNSSNSSTELGGAVAIVRPSCNCDMSDSTFTSNGAEVGGGVAVSQMDSTLLLSLDNCNFSANSVSDGIGES